MEIPEDPAARLDLLVRTLSEMMAPYGYTVRFGWDGKRDGMSQAFLGVADRRGARAGYLCVSYFQNLGGREGAAAALLSLYGEYGSWPYWDVRSDTWLSVPGGSPEELALKAAAGVKAVRCVP